MYYISEKRRKTHNRYRDLIKKFNIDANTITMNDDDSKTFVRESAELIGDSKEDI